MRGCKFKLINSLGSECFISVYSVGQIIQARSQWLACGVVLFLQLTADVSKVLLLLTINTATLVWRHFFEFCCSERWVSTASTCLLNIDVHIFYTVKQKFWWPLGGQRSDFVHLHMFLLIFVPLRVNGYVSDTQSQVLLWGRCLNGSFHSHFLHVYTH